ncbi:hypothetical protein FXN61_25485 [Lentzea sp. PSKA42]|uniref:Uncharacterized protein n=1 Tax=Lentzea indica TaxID=2604800 RepID=A0ABX1FLU1_9PSEU|nr:hypothetical protein [Lentzea indica]NKE59969.1 hypothetical protein [Lentzea indica]
MTDWSQLVAAADGNGRQAIDAVMRAAAAVVSGKDEVRTAHPDAMASPLAAVSEQVLSRSPGRSSS